MLLALLWKIGMERLKLDVRFSFEVNQGCGGFSQEI
jgi:hypothetical protein